MLRESAQENVPIIRLAHLYQCKGLFECCRKSIIDNLKVVNFVESIKVCNEYEIHKGMDTLIKFGKKHPDELKKLDLDRELSHIFRVGVLEREDTANESASDESDEEEHRLCVNQIHLNQ